MGDMAAELDALDAPSLLARLIDAADRALNRPAPLGAVSEEFNALRAALERRAKQPHFPWCIRDEALLLATAVKQAAPLDGDSERGLAWRMVASALLPLVRATLGRALEERAQAAMRSDEDAQPYRRPLR